MIEKAYKLCWVDNNRIINFWEKWRQTAGRPLHQRIEALKDTYYISPNTIQGSMWADAVKLVKEVENWVQPKG